MMDVLSALIENYENANVPEGKYSLVASGMHYLNRTILLASCLVFFVAPFISAQTASNVHLYQITVGNKSGFIDQTGKIVIQPKFDGERYMFGGFFEGLAEFKDMKALPEYPFSKEGFIDISGRVVIKPQFDVAYDFSNGRAQVKIGDLTSFIDKTGKNFVKLKPYQAARSFSEGLAAVYSNFEFWYIDPNGKIVIPKQPGLPKDFSEGLACVYIPVDGKLKAGYIDKKGKVIVEPKFEDGRDFSEGLAAIKIDGKFGYIDRTGQIIIAPKYNTAYRFSNGLARVSSGEKYGYINQIGSMIIPEKYHVMSGDFSEGLAPVCVNGKCGYVDTSGKYIVEPQYESAYEFKGGIAMVQNPYKIDYINKLGKYIWEPSI